MAPMLFRAPAGAPRWRRWLLYSAGARIMLFALLVMGLGFIARLAFDAAGFAPRDLPRETRAIFRFMLQAAITVLAYVAVVKWIERRRLHELALRDAAPRLAGGIVAGALLVTAVVAILWVAGAYRIERFDPSADWVVPLLTGGVGAAVSEEIIFRGVLYRMVEEGLGTAAALAVSAVLFGAVHMLNVGSTLWSSLAIAIEAGLLLGLVWQLTRSLWPCIGLHMGWNFFQGWVWGVPVSGTNEPSFIVSSRPGPEWLTGGAWGVEASLVAVLLNLAVALALLARARRQGLWVPLRGRSKAPIMDGKAPSAEAPC